MFVFRKDNSIKQLCWYSVLLYETAPEGYSHHFFTNSFSTAVSWRKALYWNFRKVSTLYQTWVMLCGPVWVVELPCFRSPPIKSSAHCNKVTHASSWFGFSSWTTSVIPQQPDCWSQGQETSSPWASYHKEMSIDQRVFLLTSCLPRSLWIALN